MEFYIEEHKKEIISNLIKLLQIPSVKQKSNDPNIPFGIEINNALLFMLNLGKQLGFRTKNIDNKCGYIEFGPENTRLIGIICHLDVVPSGNEWSFEPFSRNYF